MAIEPIKRGVPGFRPPLVSPAQPLPEVANVSFGDLVRMLAEGIADAQLALDRASAEMAVELANSQVDIVPVITETVDKDGNVSFSRADLQTVSLLEIGIMPTFYQFREATIEVSMDVHIVESTNEQTKQKSRGLFASTRDVQMDRRFNRDTKMASRLTAVLVPVPSPIRIEPIRRTERSDG
ncbi:hypothetical protein [Sandarakinorhabdus sp.]|uniref:hypothetical protein n=1 Tax=Sandarakinorhabdus sp. TaxID=1916663 RepID=UPI00286DD6E6|nr:hypothetical protein [Sandarakinorhabdus sp.]